MATLARAFPCELPGASQDPPAMQSQAVPRRLQSLSPLAGPLHLCRRPRKLRLAEARLSCNIAVGSVHVGSVHVGSVQGREEDGLVPYLLDIIAR